MKNLEIIIATVLETKITDMCKAIFHNWWSAIWLETDKSDIDLVIIVDDFSYRDLIIEKLSKVFSLHENGAYNWIYQCTSYIIMWVMVDISFFKKGDFLEYTQHFYDSVVNYKKHVSRIKHKVIDAKPVYDPLNMLAEAVSHVGTYPPAFKKELIKDLLDEINHHIEYISFSGLKNRYESQFVARDIITPACMAIYALNDSFFMLWFKRLHHDLPKFSWDFMTLIDALLESAYNYNPDTMVSIWKKIYNIIENYKK